MKNTFILFLILHCMAMNAQFTVVDSIMENKVTDVQLTKKLLYYATYDGKISEYDIEKKVTAELFQHDNMILRLQVTQKHIFFISETTLNIVDRASGKLTSLEDSEMLNALFVSGNDLFYGGKSGKVYRYNIRTGKKKVLFQTKSRDYIYWITDICYIPESQKIVVAAGDLFYYDCRTEKHIHRIKDDEYGIYKTTVYKDEVFYSNSAKNATERFSKLTLGQSGLKMPYSEILNAVSDSLIVMSSKDGTSLYDYISNKKAQQLSRLESINCDYNNELLCVNYYNKIFFYKKSYAEKYELKLTTNINFESNLDKFENEADSDTIIKNIIKFYCDNENEIVDIRISGNIDSSEEAGKRVSLQRAEKVKQILSGYIRTQLLSIENRGGSNQLTTEGRKRKINRRVEIVFTVLTREVNTMMRSGEKNDVLLELVK